MLSYSQLLSVVLWWYFTRGGCFNVPCRVSLYTLSFHLNGGRMLLNQLLSSNLITIRNPSYTEWSFTRIVTTTQQRCSWPVGVDSMSHWCVHIAKNFLFEGE